MTGLPPRPGRGPGAVRRHARPDRPGQDPRRRAAGRGLWRLEPDHGLRLPRRADLPGRDPLGQPAGDGRRPDDPATAPRRVALRPARSPLGPPRRGARPRGHRRGHPPRRPARREHAHPVLQSPGRSTTTRTRSGATRACSRASSGRCSPAGVYLPCSQFEAAFVSAAHTEADIDHTVAAAAEALRLLSPA